MEVVPGAGVAGDTVHLVLPGEEGRRRSTGRDLRSAKPSLDENNRPAVSFTLTSDGSRKFGKATGENIGRSLAIVLDKRVRSAPRIDGRITDRGHDLRLASRREEVNDLSLTLRSGALPAVAHIPRGTRHRPDARRRLDPIRRHRLARRPGAGRRLHADLLQAVGRQRRRRADHEPGHPARADGVLRRDDDAARHRRLRADDGHRRRLERADLRAHQGGARGPAGRARRRSTPASAACSGRCSTRTSRR